MTLMITVCTDFLVHFIAVCIRQRYISLELLLYECSVQYNKYLLEAESYI